MIPVAGSAYTYGYATLGEIFAWNIGWDFGVGVRVRCRHLSMRLFEKNILSLVTICFLGWMLVGWVIALVWVVKVNDFSAPGMRASKRYHDCLTGTYGGFARMILSLLFQNDDGHKCEEEAKYAQAPQSSRISTGSACSRFEPAGRGPLHAVIAEPLLW
jgi:hypothetical protein